MTLVQFNMNRHVRVRLTDVGRAELKRQHDELNAWLVARGGREIPDALTEVDGWSRWQLWSLMQSLGHLCSCGSALPFETDIVFEVEDVSRFVSGSSSDRCRGLPTVADE